MKIKVVSLLLSLLLVLGLAAGCAVSGADLDALVDYAAELEDVLNELEDALPEEYTEEEDLPQALPDTFEEKQQEQQSEQKAEPAAQEEEQASQEEQAKPEAEPAQAVPDEDGVYDSKEDVALYLHTYHKLPSNYITKKEAQELGWEGGSLKKIAPGKCIGGAYFSNFEKLLPQKKGRSYHECDIDTLNAKSRGAKRLVYSNDGLIYYTEDHYQTFELLYGDPS